jgi:hypothetical protein
MSRLEFKGKFGNVRVYTRRHINGCPLRDPNEGRCSCPKWIYSYPKDGKPTRRAAGTPSFAEACEEAQKLFRGFEPEIRAARATVAEPETAVSVAEAVGLYLKGMESRRLSAGHMRGTRNVLDHSPASTRRNGGFVSDKMNLSLLDFLDERSGPGDEAPANNRRPARYLDGGLGHQ